MTKALDEDIKTAALEARVPSELEQHFVMNRARLITYEQVRSETQAYIKARRGQFAFKTVATKRTSHPMEVYRKVMVRVARKKVNVRTRTRIQARTLFVGWHCGKKGHSAQNIC